MDKELKSADKFLREFYSEKDFRERDSLLKLPDNTSKDLAIESAKKKLRGYKKSVNSEKMSENQYSGYAFEFEMWNWFMQLKPNWTNFPHKDLVLDLSRTKVPEELSEAYQDTKQTDNFVIFENHVFIIESKCTLENKKVSTLKEEIALFQNLNRNKALRVKDLCGPHAIPVFIVCTKGYEVDKKEKINSLQQSDNPVILLTEKERNYIDIVLRESGSPEFALNQFLGFFRKNKNDYNRKKFSRSTKRWNKEKFAISAFSSNSGMGERKNVFTFSISPREMLKISSVTHHKANTVYEAEGANEKYYQRLLSEKRLQDVGDHLTSKQTPFPNNILVSYRGKNKLAWKAESSTKPSLNSGRVPGVLSFDACPGTFHVIDGQHRLFGYLKVDPRENGILDSHRLIVTAFKNLTVEEEADIFLEVNQKSQKVATDLIMEIEYATQGDSKSNLLNATVFKLRDNDISSLKGKVFPAEVKTVRRPDGTPPYCIKPTDLKSGLDKMEIVGNTKSWQHSKFFEENVSKSSENLFNFLNHQLNIIENTSGFWFGLIRPKESSKKWFSEDMKKSSKGFLQNIIVRGLLLLIDDVANYLISKNPSISLKDLTTQTGEIIKTFSNNFNADRKKYEYFDVKNKYQYGDSGGGLVASLFIRDFLLQSKFKDLFTEKHVDRISKIGSIADKRIIEDQERKIALLEQKLEGQQDPEERARLLEGQFRSEIHNLFSSIFIGDYWHKDLFYKESFFRELVNQAQKIKDQNEDELDGDPQANEALCENDIEYLEWIQFVQIIEELFNKSVKYEKYLKKEIRTQDYSDLQSLIKHLFFVSLDKPAKNCNFKEGTKWMRTYNSVRKPTAHPVRGRAITSNQREEIIKLEDKVKQKLKYWNTYIGQ
tara:strand:- start:1595 stop:4246 length:2652 start_codon:yes stop_codon:yes gene_type:complete